MNAPLALSPPVAPADCRRCGACCFSASPTFVRVTGDDWTRLGADAETFAHFVGHRAFMRMSGGHCAALEIRPEANGATGFFCTLYERRPQTCRDLARGSAQCAGEIATKAVVASPKASVFVVPPRACGAESDRRSPSA